MRWVSLLVTVCFFPFLIATDSTSFPDPVSADEFEAAISEHLQLVEFYSPACHHCKKLAPIWEQAWREFEEEGQKLAISFIQVNCLANGDLCAREHIEAYPSIKLYGPNGFIKDFPRMSKRNVKTLIDFAREEALNVDNFDASLLESKSTLIEGPELLDVLNGNAQKPFMISFWPSNALRKVDEKSTEFSNCDSCPDFQKTWTILSNKLNSEDFNVAHFNCEANKKICQELGFKDLAQLTNHRSDREPRVALVLPNKTTNNLFFYKKKDYSVGSLEDFAERYYANSQIPEINRKSLGNLVHQPFNFNTKDSVSDIYVVFGYDPKTVVPEDFDMLEHLLEPISNVPNARLFKSSDNMMEFSHHLLEKMHNVINYEEPENARSLNEEAFTLNSLTQYPTFFIFKQGSMIPQVFHGYSTTELRNLGLVKDWINQESLPLINEVTAANVLQLLDFQPDYFGKMAIQLVDTSSKSATDKSLEYLNNFILSAYGYEFSRTQFLYESVLAERTKKDEAVKAMKDRHDAPADIVRKMRDEIPHACDRRVLFTYLDLSVYESTLYQIGLNGEGRELHSGDVLIVDKGTGSSYYERDRQGAILTTEVPHQLEETLAILNFPSKYPSSSIPGVKFKRPQHGVRSIFAWLTNSKPALFLAALIVLVLLTRLPKIYKRSLVGRRYRNKRDMVGILGKQKPIE